jgi:cytochrome d ubiquinol oxidase subunit II
VHAAYAAAGLLWFVVFIYALAGSVDFGATFWRMRAARTGERAAHRVAERYVSPLWEATNVFLVLIVVALVGFFPDAAYAFGSVLLVPGSLILILLALRGGFLSHAYGRGAGHAWAQTVTGLTAVLLPALLISVLPISQGGLVDAVGGRLTLNLTALLGSPTEYAYLAFGLSAGLYISATFLADYARTAGDEEAYGAFRIRALAAGPVTILAGVAALFIIPSAPWFSVRLRAEWPWFVASLAAFAAAYAVLIQPGPVGRIAGRPRWAVVLVGVQFALAQTGYGLAHAPFLLYPYVRTVSTFASAAMFSALVWVVVVGLVVLIPGFIWLWRLFILDTRYTRS